MELTEELMEEEPHAPREWRRTKRFLEFALHGVIGLPFFVAVYKLSLMFLQLLMLDCRISPYNYTYNVILHAARRVGDYAAVHGQLPSTLEELPLRDRYFDSNFDYWHRPLRYSVDAASCITIESLGKDNRVGGHGEDRDVTCLFNSRRKDGAFWPPEAWCSAKVHVHRYVE